MGVQIKRAYDSPARIDGFRVLVDRLWPRGVSKEALHLDAWYRDLAPSATLRRWFAHDPARWDEFRRRYRTELQNQRAQDLLADLAERAKRGTVTLVFATRDAEHNNAVALREILRQRRP